MIILFDLSGVQFGGWASFAAHLALCLRAAKEEVLVLRVGANTENKVRHWRGVGYQNVSLDAAVGMSSGRSTLLTAVGKKQAGTAAYLLERNKKLSVCYHDPTETHVVALGARMVVIREKNLVPGATFLRHPYYRAFPTSPREFRAVAYSRLDWDKHTHTIVAANELARNKVAIFGVENRLFTHHKLPDGWRTNYHGAMPADLRAGADVAARGALAVDLSVIRGDGGGTQYTHLEAFDAGTPLVLHAGWEPAGDLAAACTTVATAEDLAALLDSGVTPSTNAAAQSLLAKHTDPQLTQAWRDFIHN